MHRELMRNDLLDLTTIVHATAYCQRNYVGTYSRYISARINGKYTQGTPKVYTQVGHQGAARWQRCKAGNWIHVTVKACMTGCSHQAYQDASIQTVRQRLFFVSVCALQWTSGLITTADKALRCRTLAKPDSERPLSHRYKLSMCYL